MGADLGCQGCEMERIGPKSPHLERSGTAVGGETRPGGVSGSGDSWRRETGVSWTAHPAWIRLSPSSLASMKGKLSLRVGLSLARRGLAELGGFPQEVTKATTFGGCAKMNNMQESHRQTSMVINMDFSSLDSSVTVSGCTVHQFSSFACDRTFYGCIWY